MDPIETLADFIRRHERGFANRLAVKLIPPRNVSIWMILIPFLLVFHLYDMKRLSTGRKEFTDHFMIAVERALGAAIEALRTKTNPDYRMLATLPSIPEAAHDAHEELLRVMTEHYATLLRGKGGSFAELARNVYKTRMAYLTTMRDRDQALRTYSSTVQTAALPEGVKVDEEAISEVLDHLDQVAQELRAQDADRIFEEKKSKKS